MPADPSASYTYRRTYDRSLWHFYSNCPDWPTDEFVEETATPSTGLYCPKCLSSERAGTCHIVQAGAAES